MIEVLGVIPPRSYSQWGEPPWVIDFHPETCPAPEEVDVAIIGGGLTGLAAAAWLRRLAPEKTVALLEASHLGAGASGRTGGLALPGSAAGELPGLEDVLAGFQAILRELEVNCDLVLSGVWEIAHRTSPPGAARSPIAWTDSGTLTVVDEVPGGSVDPGKLVSGLARAAQRLGAMLFEQTNAVTLDFEAPLRVVLPYGHIRARQVLFATNAQSLELSGLAKHGQPKLTLAVATAPLQAERLEPTGLARRKPFYTVDLPYLWGRLLANHGVVFGSGLIHADNWRELDSINVSSGAAAEILAGLERRIRGLHPALRDIEFTHRWGGPILFSEGWRPVFSRHPKWRDALVLGAYSGHGVALSVYLAAWAAEVLLGRKQLPEWGDIAHAEH